MTATLLPTVARRFDLDRRTWNDLAPSHSEVKILLVDDQPANLLALEAVLEGLGHTLVTANSGDEALKRILHEDFAVILMDVFMPGIDGFETAQIIRQRERSRFTPIVFLTAIGKDDTHVSRGYSVGGVDYLFKPIVPEILQAKVAAFVDLFVKSAIVANQAEQLREMERQWHRAELAEAQHQLQVERHQQNIRAARKVQQSLFPQGPPVFPGFDIAGASHPTDATGGDYFDYIKTPHGFLDIAVADVSGHGLAAALLMSSTRGYLRGLAMAGTGIDDILKHTNRALAADLDDSRFVTLLYARLSPDGRSVTFSSAGHLPGFVLSADGQVKTTLDSTGMPLGIFSDFDFPAGPQIDLAAGDILFLYTDGVTEALSPDGATFGAERALEVLRENCSRTAAEMVDALYYAVSSFVERNVLEDDLTAVLVKISD